MKSENERIDLKSTFEKATLEANSRNHTQRRSLLHRAAATDSSKSPDENVFPSTLHSTTAAEPSNDQTNKLHVIREKLSAVEADVKRKRRELRNWDRDNKHFAVEVCPELFQILPDFRTPGSVLGDGGFADMAQVRTLYTENYIFHHFS